MTAHLLRMALLLLINGSREWNLPIQKDWGMQLLLPLQPQALVARIRSVPAYGGILAARTSKLRIID